MTRNERNELKELGELSGHRIVITKYFVTVDGKTFSNDEKAYQLAKNAMLDDIEAEAQNANG